MLYSPAQFQRDQLLQDLLAVRQRVAAPGGWAKQTWRRGQGYCLVGSVQAAVGAPVGVARLSPDQPADQRVGRALAALYLALHGPHAPTNVTMSQVVSRIISFNDSHATKPAVLLLLDRAIAAVQQSAGATVTASA